MDNTSPKQMSDAWLIDGSLLYRLNADDANRDEIDVRMVDGSRALGPRIERAWALRDLLRVDQKASPLPVASQINAAAAHGEVALGALLDYRPLITLPEHGAEPSLREIVLHYYMSHGIDITKARGMAGLYIGSLLAAAPEHS